MLKGKGCTGGPDKPSAGNDKIFSCPGVGKLSFRFSTTAGNQLRALTFEVIQRQLKSVGIELVPRFQPAGLLFGTTLPSSDWDIMMFTWVEAPSSKITAKDKLACGGDINYGNYCNRRATALLNRTATELDDATRTKLLNQAEALMVNDVPSIPMFVRPVFTIATKNLKGRHDPDDARGQPLEREHLDDQLTPSRRVTGDCLHDPVPPPPLAGAGLPSNIRSRGGEGEMFQFVIRRLLYSIVVLFAASVLVFTFVAKTGDPLAALALNPRISAVSRSRTSRSASTSTTPSPCATATG